MSALRAFPVLHARDVEAVADFYVSLGFAQSFRLNGEDGRAGYIGLRREGGAELAVTTEDAPHRPGGQPRGAGQPAPGVSGRLSWSTCRRRPATRSR